MDHCGTSWRYGDQWTSSHRRGGPRTGLNTPLSHNFYHSPAGPGDVTERCDRRALLAAAGTGATGVLAGCVGAIPGFGGDGDSGNRLAAEAWPMPRGTAEQTGASASGGPGPDATETFTATLREGIDPLTGRGPIVGTDGLYAVGREASPYSYDPPRFRLYAYRLSRSDGSEDWRRVLLEQRGGVGVIREYDGPVPTDDGVVVTWRARDSDRLRVAALSRADGSTNWSTELTVESDDRPSPVVHGDTVYIFDGSGSLTGLSTTDGSEQWQSAQISGTARSLAVGGRGIAVYTVGEGDDSGSRLTVLDPSDGSQRWSDPYGESRSPTPTVAGDTVYLTDGGPFGTYSEGSPVDVPPRDIHALSIEDGSERWSHTYDTEAVAESFSPGGTGSVTVADDHVYYALGFPTADEFLGQQPATDAREEIQSRIYEGPNVVALDRSDGSVDWQTRLGTQARVFLPMVADPDRLYALYWGRGGDDENPTRVYVLDRSNGDVLGEFGPVPEDSYLAVADGTLYTHRDDQIRAWE